MSKSGLTAKYRPQTFAEMVGQDFIKKILSRASQQDRPASAYLFSGTRGVGKTTAARILAKAMNCLNGPDFEPCNKCRHCAEITKGVFPDVIEIDAASHTGVDNVRKLREDVGYMPMSGRYKVIIIDEAHMLSTAAFNALLKTLEEPPRHCVFIMATTAPEKFPATVVSRCQHYVFKMVSLENLVQHLKWVLDTENVEYDPEAVRLVAVRGAGSVRDSMSILGQVMAIGGDRIEPANVREVLGLAGQEVYADFFKAILNKDLIAIHSGIKSLMDKGLDISFFLQEFAGCWRTLFLLSKSGKSAAKIIELPTQDIDFWFDMAGRIPDSLIHAGWQMVIEERKAILKSHEPSQALELLFFNLAFLPDLLPVGEFKKIPEASYTELTRQTEIIEDNRPDTGQSTDAAQKPAKQPLKQAELSKIPDDEEIQDKENKDWPGFMQFVCGKHGRNDSLVTMLNNCEGRLQDNVLIFVCKQDFIFENIRKNGREKLIADLTNEYFGSGIKVDFVNNAPRHDNNYKEKALNHPAVQKVIKDFDAKIVEIKRSN